MKATGIVRKVDDLGRIVIPKEIRTSFGWDKGTPLEMFVDNGKVVLKFYEPCCTFCGSVKDMVRYKEKLVCQECIDDMKGRD